MQRAGLLEEYKGINILALAFDENAVLYASNQFGLSRSNDLGRTWEKISGLDLTITSIAVDAQNKIIYVSGYSRDGYQEVYRTKDDYSNWEIIGTNKGS